MKQRAEKAKLRQFVHLKVDPSTAPVWMKHEVCPSSVTLLREQEWAAFLPSGCPAG